MDALSDAKTITKTYRYRVKDKHAAALGRMARTVNFVWNFCNDTQRTAVQRGNRWPTHFDLSRLMAGSCAELGVPFGTLNSICKQYAQSRKRANRERLRYRGRRSLGWIPIRKTSIRAIADRFRFNGRLFSIWYHRELPAGATILDGSTFSSDARGRWYLNVVVKLERSEQPAAGEPIGIDLGLKSLVTLSTGEAVAAPQHFRRGANRYGKAQRANKKRLVRTLAAKIANQRRDFLHKLSARLVAQHGAIYVGNVSSVRLARTSMAKSVLDAGWSSLRRMLQYKCDYAGSIYREVNENGSTVICSECGSLSGPGGRQGLVVREWACGTCGVVHDRDVNAATNILRWATPAPTGIRAVA